MHMAVNDAGHDEFPAEVCDIAFIFGKACLIAHIDEFSVLHRKGGSLRMVLVRCENLCIFNNMVCSHILLLFVMTMNVPVKFFSISF